MAVLNDTTLRQEIQAGRLIRGGDVAQVKYCAYQCLPEKIFPPGAAGAAVDWMVPTADDSYVIAPGALVWVRVKGVVEMPADRCAFYWQTNSLSRQGLMLVNSSLVEPGYVGPLACLFANFGKDPVTIDPGTPVAKLIFLQLDQAAAEPLALRLAPLEYDRELKKVAVKGPESFLQVSELAGRLDRALHDAVAQVKSDAEAARKAEERELTKFREAQEDTMKTNVVDSMKKTFYVGAVAFVIAVMALNVSYFIQGYLRPSFDTELGERVEAAVRSRLAVNAATAAARDSVDAATQRALGTLQRTVDSLRRAR